MKTIYRRSTTLNYPAGIASLSPGLAAPADYPGSSQQKIHNPERVAARSPKTHNSQLKTHNFALLTIVVTVLISFSSRSPAANYTAHEWGTFTSVQGANCNLLSWRPLQSSELPKFVYSSKLGDSGFPLKTGLITLQRLETPVIYFYSSEPLKVDVDVSFPRGVFTEWYPNVTQLGVASIGTNTVISLNSRAIWQGLDIFPDLKETALLGTNQLPQDSAGSHYFAARRTGANFVRANITTNNTTELEKFIFYRGAGNFKTPLRVTVDTNNMVTVENTGAQPLPCLFFLHLHNGKADYESIAQLAPGASWSWQPLNDTDSAPWIQFGQPAFKNTIGFQMQSALTNAGLYPDEAEAMVNTWKDSWFTDDGVRVLYILPRPWTDEILPLKLTPQPAELTRVMVGRAEVIMPQVENNLFQLLSTAQTGDTNAQSRAIGELKHLGRFSDPALQLAMSHTTNSALINFSYQLLHPPQPALKFE